MLNFCHSALSSINYSCDIQVPRESLLFVIPAFGGIVSWEGDGAPFREADQSITHQVSSLCSQLFCFLLMFLLFLLVLPMLDDCILLCRLLIDQLKVINSSLESMFSLNGFTTV